MITGKGGTENLQISESADPHPGPGQVTIDVEAAGVNFADVMMRLGLYPDAPKLPAVPGYEVAGTVAMVGANVDSSLLGKPVVAMCNFGGYSEKVCVDSTLVFERPTHLEATAAAALPVNYLTAWQMVKVMAPVTAGDRVLVHSAAGGVGQAVLQLCQTVGAKVVGSASEAKHEALLAQGLDYVFDSRQKEFATGVKAATGGQGVDVALEPRNGRWIYESYLSLAKCGRLVLFGFSNAAQGHRSGTFSALKTLAQVPWFQLNPIRLMNDNKSIGGVNLGRMWDQSHRTAQWMKQLMDLFEVGAIAPKIDSIFPFSQAGKAHERLETRANFGKVILVPDERWQG